MARKVKYRWKLLHGDDGVYEFGNTILSKEEDINFFDYVLKLNFNHANCEGFDNILEEEKTKLIKLFDKTFSFYKNWNSDEFSESLCNNKGDLNDIYNELMSINYIVKDFHSVGNYAKIKMLERKEFTTNDIGDINGTTSEEEINISINKEFLLNLFQKTNGDCAKIVNENVFFESCASRAAMELNINDNFFKEIIHDIVLSDEESCIEIF